LKITIEPNIKQQWLLFGDLNPRIGVIFYDLVRKAEAWGVRSISIQSIEPKSINITLPNSEIVSSIVNFINLRYTYDMARTHIKTAEGFENKVVIKVA